MFRKFISVRRARHEYEKAYLARLLAELREESARREAESAVCKWCEDARAPHEDCDAIAAVIA